MPPSHNRSKQPVGLVALAWAAMFVALGLVGLDDVPDLGLDRADLAAHLGATGLLAALVADWRGERQGFSWAGLAAFTLALGIEFAQLLTRDRTFQWADVLADALGGAAAIVVYRRLAATTPERVLDLTLIATGLTALALGGWVLAG